MSGVVVPGVGGVDPTTTAAQRSGYWPVPLARAVPAAVMALVVTFSADHSAPFGLTVFAAYAVVSGLIGGILARTRLIGTAVRPYLVAQGAISVLLGLVAIPFIGGGVSIMFVIISLWAAVTGALELSCGIRTRRGTRHPHIASGDWITMGAITLLAAFAFVLVPPEYSETYTVDDFEGVLDAAIVVTGALGAYGAIAAVFLLIAGFSAKWGTSSQRSGQQAAKGVAS